MSLLSEMPHEIDIYHVTYPQDGLAAHVPTETRYARAQAADVQPASTAVINEFKARDQNVTHQVFLQSNPGLRLDDVIVVGSGPYDGTRLSIRGFHEATAGRGLAWMIAAESDREEQ